MTMPPGVEPGGIFYAQMISPGADCASLWSWASAWSLQAVSAPSWPGRDGRAWKSSLPSSWRQTFSMQFFLPYVEALQE